MGQSAPSSQLSQIMGMLCPGEFAQTLHGTKNLFFWKCRLKIKLVLMYLLTISKHSLGIQSCFIHPCPASRALLNICGVSLRVQLCFGRRCKAVAANRFPALWSAKPCGNGSWSSLCLSACLESDGQGWA